MKESILLVVILLGAVHASKIQLNSYLASPQKPNNYIENENARWDNGQEVRDHRFRFAHTIIHMIADSLRQVNRPTQSADENGNYQQSVSQERNNPQDVEEENQAEEEFRREGIPQQSHIESTQQKWLLGENEYEHMPREIPSVAEARYMTQANLRVQQPQLRKDEGQEMIEEQQTEEQGQEQEHELEHEQEQEQEHELEQEQEQEHQIEDDQSNTLPEKAPAGTNEQWSDIKADLIRDERVARMFFGEREEQRQSHSLQREDAATGEYRQISPDEESALGEEEGSFKAIRP